MTSVEVRQSLVESLRLDLVGPDNDHPFAKELLPESPTRWYLAGFLVPTAAPDDQRVDETSVDEIDAPAADAGGTDDATQPDRAAARRSILSSSMGLSVLVPGEAKTLEAIVSWGDYVYEGPEGEGEPAEADEHNGQKDNAGPPKPETASETPKGAQPAAAATAKPPKGFRRTPRTERVTVTLPSPNEKPAKLAVPASNGLALVVTVRSAATAGLPQGTRAVSVFLVNYRLPNADHPYRAFIYQARLDLECREGFVPRPDPRGWDIEDEWDERVADVQYRDVCEFAVGHGVSAAAEVDGACACGKVRTTWIPEAEVDYIAPSEIADVELGIEALGALADAQEAERKLTPLVAHYRAWIDKQRQETLPKLKGHRAQTATEMLQEAGRVADRIEAGIALLKDADVLEAFKVANRAVAQAARHRFGHIQGKDPAQVDTPTWRPFQLAFLLMTLRGITEPAHGDREEVDLLFFPTGGGKTEAYLGLAAFTIVFRRLKNPGVQSAGLSVLMRYTLRLLTLDQLGRAAGLICALELEREKNPDRLGEWPFEIGLWVGQAATPNRLGGKGQRDPECRTAYCKTRRFQQDSERTPAPIPLEECPWCGTKFNRNSFRLVPNDRTPLDLRVHCANYKCTFHGDRHLPIVAVDEPIYRRLPCFLIATVDKFAALPWTGEVGTLFGMVDRHDKNGFYGPCDKGMGQPIPGGRLPPPDLIIQDELHLISGPLGTVAGLYETAIDALATREVEGRRIRPKIIASTATVRRADTQIRALFERCRVSVFPSPVPDRRDSFFARTLPSEECPARIYVGVAAQGRSLKVVLLRTSLALLSAGQTAWEAAGGDKRLPNPADPYMTLVGYFNSLRELGGSRRIIEDEVRTRLTEYGRRRRRDPQDTLFRDREIEYDVLELTSRVSTNAVAAAKRRLACDFHLEDGVDVALATNMISVGLDITRLGLMVVLGQPKMSAEYIQATSRVGRDPARPGLIVTLLNIHKPRDRSHYERFAAYHESFYRCIEATSVTPFSPRALDRALPAALVGLCRHGRADMTPARAAREVMTHRADLDALAQRVAERAREHDRDMGSQERQALHAQVLHRCGNLLDDWLKIAQKAQQEGSGLQYQKEETSPPRRLLYDFLDPELPNRSPVEQQFRANRSMRDVEPMVDIDVQNLKDWGNKP